MSSVSFAAVMGELTARHVSFREACRLLNASADHFRARTGSDSLDARHARRAAEIAEQLANTIRALLLTRDTTDALLARYREAHRTSQESLDRLTQQLTTHWPDAAVDAALAAHWGATGPWLDVERQKMRRAMRAATQVLLGAEPTVVVPTIP